jgi:hypothetical protein
MLPRYARPSHSGALWAPRILQACHMGGDGVLDIHQPRRAGEKLRNVLARPGRAL